MVEPDREVYYRTMAIAMVTGLLLFGGGAFSAHLQYSGGPNVMWLVPLLTVLGAAAAVHDLAKDLAERKGATTSEEVRG